MLKLGDIISIMVIGNQVNDSDYSFKFKGERVDNGLVPRFEELKFVKLLIRAIFEEANRNGLTYTGISDVIKDLRVFGTLDGIPINKVFFCTISDGRSRRIYINPDNNQESACYKFLEYLANLLNNTRIIGTGIMIQLKGSGSNFKTFKEAQKSFFEGSFRPYGLTELDNMENSVAEILGKFASRFLLFTINVESIIFEGEVVVPKNILTSIFQNNLTVLEILVVPGGHNLEDLMELKESEKWEALCKVIYLYTGHLFIPGKDLTNENKKQITKFLYDIYIRNSNILAVIKDNSNSPISFTNRSEQNQTLIYSQDFDTHSTSIECSEARAMKYMNILLSNLEYTFSELYGLMMELMEDIVSEQI